MENKGYIKAIMALIDYAETLEKIINILPDKNKNSRDEYREFLEELLEEINNSNKTSELINELINYLNKEIESVNMLMQADETANFIIDEFYRVIDVARKIKSNSPDHMRDFKKIFDISKDRYRLDSVRGNKEKYKSLNEISGEGQRVFELKEYQSRIIFYKIRDNFYIVIDIFVKKDDSLPDHIEKSIKDKLKSKEFKKLIKKLENMSDEELKQLASSTNEEWKELFEKKKKSGQR